MVYHSDRFYGREPVIKLVRKLMAREEVGRSLRNRHYPILVVEGFRGAGKAALLSALDELLDQRVPHARLDFEANEDASIPQVLSALAFELGIWCPRYGALRFPRFIIGQLVMDLDLDLTNRPLARRKVVAELELLRGVDTFRNVLADAAGNVLTTMSRGAGLPVEPPRNMLRIILEWLTRLAPRRIVLGSFQDWYGHRGLGATKDSVDVLVTLNQWARDAKDEDGRQRVDELLLSAFLADLRAEFDRGRRADERSLNCVVLLDNADTELGRRLLEELVHARLQRGPDNAEPLTVVATSQGVLLADVPDQDWSLVTLDDISSGQLPSTADLSRPWWRCPLPALTEAEVTRAVAALALERGNNRRLTQVVMQLTDGHPASTQLVLEAIARHPPATSLIEPEVILGRATSGERSEHPLTVEDQMLDHLLAGVADERRLRDLETCAAAREWEHASTLPVQGNLTASKRATYRAILQSTLWPADQTAGPTLLRRLLVRRLARRDPEISPSWSDVHGRLRDACRAESDELYYALAGGELGLVTQRLHQRLTELKDNQWLELLDSATAAPRQRRQRHALVEEVRVLVKEAELEQSLTSLAQLIAALWIVTDPFIDSNRRELHLQIADDYTDLAQLTLNAPSALLRDRSRLHRTEAGRWG